MALETETLARLLGMITALRYALGGIVHTLTDAQREAFTRGIERGLDTLTEKEAGGDYVAAMQETFSELIKDARLNP